MSWDKTGETVTSNYLGEFQVVGVVQASRVKYGGKVQHTVKIKSPITVYGSDRSTLLLDEDEVTVISAE